MPTQVMFSAGRTISFPPTNVVRFAACFVLLALVGPTGQLGQATLRAEGPSALESDQKAWMDILPSADLKGWYRVAVPPKAKLGREQWHVDTDKKLLVCDGDGGHDMLLFDKEFSDAIFHCEFRYVPVAGKKGYNSG